MRYICKKCHEDGFEGTVCIDDEMSKSIYYGFPITYLVQNKICKHDTKSTKDTAVWMEIKE